MISVYKVQIEMNQTEFDDMRVSLKNLQEQFQALSNTNIELRTENDRLGGSVSNQNQTDSSSSQQQEEERPVSI